MHINKWLFFENMWKKPLAFYVKHDKIFAVNAFLYKNYE